MPVYGGMTVRASAPGEPPGEAIRHSATLIAANGLLHVGLLLLIPLALTGMAVLAIYFTHRWEKLHRWLLWLPAIVLLGFCVVAMMSIGVFYLPAAVALLCGAVLDAARGSRANTHQVS